jgi:Ca2+-binding RTX toxin-like protein
VLITGDVATATGDAGSTNTLSGQGGADELYGSDGIDIFVFENATAFADLDTVSRYNTADGDALDISDILSAAGYQAGVDVLTDFVEITDNGLDSTLRVDVTGTGTFGAGTEVATILGRTGLTDEAALEASGNLITS